MAKIARILPLPQTYTPGEMTLENALAQHGYSMYPGSGQAFPPIKMPNGRYLTGLDEDADYIKRILDPAARDKEREIVRERRDRLELATGRTSDPGNRDRTGLGALSPYYSQIYDLDLMNTQEVAQRYKLRDKNTFNFNNPTDEVTYWWVIQNTKLIARSLESWKRGGEKSTVQFYIDNPEAEAEVRYIDKIAAAEATTSLLQMSLEKRLKVAKLLGLPVTDNDKERIVFNQLDDLIHSGDIKTGEYKGQQAIRLFNQICAIPDDQLARTSLVKEAINLRVLIKKGDIIYEGNSPIATSEDELVKSLCGADKQMEYLALKAKVESKGRMKQGMEYIPEPYPQVPVATTIEQTVQAAVKQTIDKAVETPGKKKREWSEEQRQAFADKMKKSRGKKEEVIE